MGRTVRNTIVWAISVAFMCTFVPFWMFVLWAVLDVTAGFIIDGKPWANKQFGFWKDFGLFLSVVIVVGIIIALIK